MTTLSSFDQPAGSSSRRASEMKVQPGLSQGSRRCHAAVDVGPRTSFRRHHPAHDEFPHLIASRAAIGLAGTLGKERDGFGDLGAGLVLPGAERPGQAFGAGNGIGHLAMIQVGGEGNEAGFGQPRD